MIKLYCPQRQYTTYTDTETGVCTTTYNPTNKTLLLKITNARVKK